MIATIAASTGTVRRNSIRHAAIFGALALAIGCSKTDDSQLNYKNALNDYYKAHPVCLWSSSKKFPVQAATSDDAKTEGYDALTDAGLLTRTTAEKKVFIIASKQVNNYDVSDKGRSVWTQDPAQPGYGNFCYGHREVTSIDTYTANTNSSGVKGAQVNYHYQVADVAGWANNQEMMTAFPSVNTSLSGSRADQASLVMNGDRWTVVSQ